jgi:peptidoglycan hydrolase-like protein with peptidoglycan-binding domain
MKLHDIAVAAAALSFAGAAVAAGNDASSAPAGGQSYSSGQSQSVQSPSSTTSSNISAQQSEQSGASSTQSHDPQSVRDVQQALKQKGFDVGAVDGRMGPETQSALREFQRSQGLPQSGNLDQQTLSALGVSAQGPSSQSTSARGHGSQASGTSSMSGGASASGASHDTDQGMQQNRDRMQNNGTTNGTETTPATPK